jgi:hypothetical protein
MKKYAKLGLAITVLGMEVFLQGAAPPDGSPGGEYAIRGED